MKKSTVWLIVVLMSIALLGLSAFQLYWINNAIQLNKQAFNKNVMASLQQVVANLERREIARLTSSQFLSKMSGENGQIQYFYHEEGVDENGKRYVRQKSDTLSQNEIDGNNFEIETIELIGKEPPSPLPPNPFEPEIASKSSGTLLKVVRKSAMVNMVIEQMINRNTINKEINLPVIDSLLQKALHNSGIDLQYEFAVWNARYDSLYTKDKHNVETLKKSSLRAALFPTDFYDDAHFLMINFPNQTAYLLKKIGATLAASLLFILIIVGCFTYAIFIIFRQKKLSEMKNDFINNMTHELKTPIATVALAVEALNEKELRSNEATLLRYLGIITEENQRLSSQVEKVLQSAILEKESLTIKKECINLHQIINQVVANNQLRIDALAGQISLALKAKNDKIKGDEQHLSNVLNNLIDNALKYTKQAPKITISTQVEKAGIIVGVSDNGMGMSADTMRHIFDKFYRAHTGNRHDVKGFGLGLSYVKTIIENHGGSIEVTSEVNKGSTFKIYLPYA